MDETTRQQVEGLEHVLSELLRLHEELLHLMEQKREALREADRERMTHVCELENEKVQAISEYEKQRVTYLATLTERCVADATEPVRMATLAEHLPEPARGRLLARRHELRERIESVRRQSSIAQKASESLMHHVDGLVGTVSSMITHAATYDRDGSPPGGKTAVSTLNVTA